jgi:glycosyltransferase involved in cell wall biosynthesis
MFDDETTVTHVMMTADAFGGVWTYALELAEQLGRLGVRTTLATMGQPLRDPQREASARLPTLSVIESGFKLEWMEEPWRDVAAAGDWLLAIEEREHPDVVHLNGSVHAALDWRAPKIVVAHSCVLSWWEAVLGEPAPAKYARYGREVARGLRAADAIVAPTRTMLETVREHYGAALGGVVIPNGVDRGRFSVSRKEPFVLAAGRLWDQAKNLRTLAQAARQVRWPVYLAGSDMDPNGSGDPVELRGAVRALGWLDIEELHRWMARASIYALPARYEPFGLSVLEAALAGCALVLGDVASLREVWGSAAVYVPSDDVVGLVDAIERIADDDRLCARMAASARARAFPYSAERMARRYLELYREMVSRRRAAAAPRRFWSQSPNDDGRGAVQPCA